MAQVSVAEAKAKFSALLERALGGEEVEITRRGKPIARLVASPPNTRPPINTDALKRLTDSMECDASYDTQAFWDDMRGRNRD